MQSKLKRRPPLSRICSIFGAFVLGATFLIAEGVLRIADFDSDRLIFKVVVWIIGLAISLTFFALGSRFAEEQRSSSDD